MKGIFIVRKIFSFFFFDSLGLILGGLKHNCFFKILEFFFLGCFEWLNGCYFEEFLI
jgi:hypothetical protein